MSNRAFSIAGTILFFVFFALFVINLVAGNSIVALISMTMSVLFAAGAGMAAGRDHLARRRY
jgi:hypothetical protein